MAMGKRGVLSMTETWLSDTHVLVDAADAVYERSDEHGEPEDSFARIAALWSGYFDQEIAETDVVNAMILLKVARNREGHYTDDNWTDIAGYAENGARLDGESDD